MRKINLTDVTISKTEGLSFKDKVEMAKIMDKLNFACVDLPIITNVQTDSLLNKTLATTLKEARLCADATDDVEIAWESIKSAKRPILKVALPTSTVQMEYHSHVKPAKMIEVIDAKVKACKEKTVNVEFEALDATRAEFDFLKNAIATAIAAGATKITVCDTEGRMMPDEFGEFIAKIIAEFKDAEDVIFAVSVVNTLGLATACAFAAIKAGASEIKTDTSEIESIVDVIDKRGADLGISASIKSNKLKTGFKNVKVEKQNGEAKEIAKPNVDVSNVDFALSADDTQETVTKAAKTLGYNLTESEENNVYAAFKRVAVKKSVVDSKELDVIIATSAFTAPATYELVNYVINCGNIIKATANITLKYNGEELEGVATGDGPIDAAFTAINQIVGHEYELDDFQILTASVGSEAAGRAIIKLRADSGKLYASDGISTDIIGASIHAYVDAINKIVYEEA